MVTHNLVLQAVQSLSAPYREKLPEDGCFLGFTVTKKVGHAHLRNRTKRRLRAAAREVFPQLALPKFDYVLIGRYSTAGADFKTLVGDMKMAVKRINKLLKPKPGSQVSAEEQVSDEASVDTAN